jgi:hypothetical protein
LLGNDYVNTFLRKKTRATIEGPLLGNGSVKHASLTIEAVFSAWSMQVVINKSSVEKSRLLSEVERVHLKKSSFERFLVENLVEFWRWE